MFFLGFLLNFSNLNSMRKYSSIFKGIIDTSPLILAAAPFGIIFGALGISSGLSEWAIMAMSLFVFAGASQFIAITLLTVNAALPVIFISVFFVNLRHILYAITLMNFVADLKQKLRIPIAFLLTDETFAVVSNRIMKKDKNLNLYYYYLGSAVSMYCMWSICTFIGIFLGQKIPDITNWGLEIAMILAFVGIVVPNLNANSDWFCAGTALFFTILTHHWPNQTGLLFSSLIAIIIAVLIETKNKFE